MSLKSLAMYIMCYSIHIYCHPQIMPKLSPSLIGVSLECPWSLPGSFLKSSRRFFLESSWNHHTGFYTIPKSSWSNPFEFTWNYTIDICCLQSKCLNHLWYTSSDLVTWLHLNNASLLSIDPKWPPKCNTKFQRHEQWVELIFDFEFNSLYQFVSANLRVLHCNPG